MPRKKPAARKGNSQTTLAREELAQMTRVTSVSDGRGRPLDALIADWAAANPKIRRVWVSVGQSGEALPVALELQPVADSEETSAIWLAHCGQWSRELGRRIGRAVDLQWLDAGESLAQARADKANMLVYERAG